MQRTSGPSAKFGFKRDAIKIAYFPFAEGMEAAKLLATHLVLPELVATVASYLDGTESLSNDREFALALFPYTGNVRIVVYYTWARSAPPFRGCQYVEHYCLVNGLLHSFGNEPARVTVSTCPFYVEHALEWKSFGHTCYCYPTRLIVSKTRNFDECFVYDENDDKITLRLNGTRTRRRLWVANGYKRCDSSKTTPCGSDCVVCRDPKFKSLELLSTIDTRVLVDKCMDAMDFRWIAQFCIPFNRSDF